MKIRLKLDNEISRVIRNYNAKIRRLEKLNIPNLILPTKITKKELIKTSSSTKEIRRKLKSLSRFSKKGAENVWYITYNFSTAKNILTWCYEDNNIIFVIQKNSL